MKTRAIETTYEGRIVSGRRAAGWLSLAAAPTFAIMAVLTGLSGAHDMVCSTVHVASPLNGMVPMYVLMTVFHCVPWLRLMSRP